MKKLLLLLFLIVTSFAANAQWYKLPAYKNPYASDTNDWFGYPLSPYPAGNGVIIYGICWGMISGGESGGIYVIESEDDLENSISLFFDGGLGGIPFLFAASKNDSTHSFIDLYNSVSLNYTSDNYKTVSGIAKFQNTMGKMANISLCFSPGYIYSAGQFYNNLSNLTDTIMVCRSSVSPLVTKQYPNTKYASPARMLFTTDSSGFMLCSYTKDSAKSVLAMTLDSGKTWSDSFLDSLPVITCSSFPSENIGYLTESNGNIYKTTNAGLSWTQLVSPATVSLNCVSFSNDTNGYVGGLTGVLYRTTDGGKTWISETSGDSYSIESLYTFDTVAYFIDVQQNIYKNEIPMGIENIQIPSSVVKVYPNPSNGKFTFKWSVISSQLTVEIYNVLGEKVNDEALRLAQGDYEIDLSSQSAGIYFYRILSNGKFVGNGKLVIER